jgi:hypothetical protein
MFLQKYPYLIFGPCDKALSRKRSPFREFFSNAVYPDHTFVVIRTQRIVSENMTFPSVVPCSDRKLGLWDILLVCFLYYI